MKIYCLTFQVSTKINIKTDTINNNLKRGFGKLSNTINNVT